MSAAPRPRPGGSDRKQRLAADPMASVWVAASAGAGKTKVLTDRVLNLLLAGTAPERVLCLTYTRAAAAEMALRVQQALGAWAIADGDKLGEAIGSLTGAAPDDATRARARALFGRVLDCPGGLKIQTIHAFCESLLRRFPLEAGLHPHFRVLDEAEARELLGEARDEVLARAAGPGEGGEADPLQAAIGGVVGQVGAEDLEKLMARVMGERGRIARLIEATGGLDGAARAVRDALGVTGGMTEGAAIAAASADGAFDAAGLGAAAETMLEKGLKTDQAHGALIADWLADPRARADGFERYARAFFSTEGERFKDLATKGLLKKLDDPDSLLAVLEAEAARLEAVRETIRALRTAEGSVAVLRLGEALIEAYRERKRARARLDYDDLILATRDLLSDRSSTQWVLYKLDGGIDHVLVDEAQDTSPEQWEVIRRLTGEFFAGEGARGGARTVFAVGDAKQSIYSFQRADPRAFAEMRGLYARDAEGAGATFRDLELHDSFRSTAPVLGAVDAVFAGPDARDGVAVAEQAIRHFPRRDGQAGLVELWPVVAGEAEAEESPWLGPAANLAGGQSGEVRLARLVAARIKEWIGTRELPSRGRTMQAGDVLILVRTRTRLVNALVRDLKALGIGVAGVDRMRLAEELAVMDLIALGRFLLQPDDDLSLACVLKGPWCGLDDDDLLELAPGREGSLWVELVRRAGERPRWEAARDWLGERLKRTDFDRPFELFSSVLDEDGGRAKLIARLGNDAEDPVNEFLELALAHERGAAPSLQGFLDWLEGGQTEVKRDLERAVRDEVRIMTVHGAKGLQAPVVILPDTCRTPTKLDGPFWLEVDVAGDLPLWAPKVEDAARPLRELRERAKARQMEEYHRLLYVAMTRAEDALHIAGWRGKNNPSRGNWHELIEAGLAGLAEPHVFDFSGYIGTPPGDGLRLEAGQEAGPDRPSDDAAEAMPDIALEGWEDAPPPAEEAPRRVLTPSDLGPEPPALSPRPGADGAEGFARGRIVHTLLQYLPDLPAEARERAARAWLARPALGLGDDAQAEIAAETLKIMAEPAFAALFGPGSRAEVPLAATVGEDVIAGRIDRLVVSGGAVLVIDYKTGRPVPATAGEVPAVYVRQMALYRAALRRIYPGRDIRAALVFTAQPKLIALPEAALEAAFLGP